MANTIKIKKYLDIIEEMEAAATITPGMLVELTSADKVQAHGTEAGDVLPMFALEDELQGKTIDDDYAADDPVQVWIPNRGEQVLALLNDGEDVSIGDFLVSAGNGRLKKDDTASSSASTGVHGLLVGVALEALDLSTSTGAWPASARRIKVRII